MSQSSLALVEVPSISEPSPASEPIPRRARRSVNNEKIALAIADEVAAGTPRETLSFLSRKELLRRLAVHLERRGMAPREMPNARALKRFLSGH